MFSSNASQVSTAANYIEDVFSTYLYTGTGASQTITNGIDLSTKGGMVWLKSRSAVGDHYLFDTSRGTTNFLGSNTTNKQLTGSTTLTAFNNNGFTLGAATATNGSGTTYTSWTFRKQAKFFDVVTYTGDGNDYREISHNLGSAPGCVIIKRTDSTSNWVVCNFQYSGNWIFNLNSTSARIDSGSTWTSSSTNVGLYSYSFMAAADRMNLSGASYVMYLFAHDAGGFGAAGTDNVISCGSFTTDGTGNATVSLGYEPQWLLIKRTDSTSDWIMQDNMRGLGVLNSKSVYLNPNLSTQEFDSTGIFGNIFATGFNQTGLSASGTYIYIAIRRGPMKTPTSGTSVFSPVASSAATGTALTTGFPVDAQIFSGRSTAATKQVFDRLRGVSSTTTESGIRLITSSTAAETAVSNTRLWDNTGFQMPSFFGGISMVFWNFRRAPGFFDVVCYTGNGTTGRQVPHNLGVKPELVIYKFRNDTGNWTVFTNFDYEMYLNLTTSLQGPGFSGNHGDPTATYLVAQGNSNTSSRTIVSYLFATVAGVSKVGSYTGTGTTQQINCGFTAGARFVLIKRTDSTGDWYVWDSARGIVAGNDPYLLLNDTAAEVTGTDYVDTYSAGFEISSTAPAAINANGGSFIFLAIA